MAETGAEKTSGLFSFPVGETALVTGGGRGIGRAICIALARAGFDIWLNYRVDDDAAARTREEILALGRSCELLRFDVADPEAVNQVSAPHVARKCPYVVVNNAGVIRDAVLVWMSLEEWRTVLRTTLDGFFLVTKAVLPALLERRRGRIVNISSTSGQAGRPGQTNYAAAKAGLIGATKALAAEVARRGVLVNAVAPGLIATEMIAGTPLDKVIPNIPLRRVGQPDEVAAAVAFLCSDQAGYITGQVLSCNGGLYV